MKPRPIFDLQNNGVWSRRLSRQIDFTSAAGITIGDCEAFTQAQIENGTAAFLATLITAPNTVLLPNVTVIRDFMDQAPLGQHCLGLHLECFLPASDGYSGAHPLEHCVKTSVDAMERYERCFDILGPKLRAITLGPNVPGITTLIERAVRDNVLVCMGHFGAEETFNMSQIEAVCAQVREAFAAGARMSTHLGNGTRPACHRHGAHITTQLVIQGLVAGLIADGVHLSDDFLQMCLMLKGLENVVLVSDASPVAGAPKGEYTFGVTNIEVVEWKGGFKVAPKGKPDIFAGSWASLLQCMNYAWGVIHASGLVRTHGLTPESVMDMASVNPLRLIGLPANALDALDGPNVKFQNGKFVLAA